MSSKTFDLGFKLYIRQLHHNELCNPLYILFSISSFVFCLTCSYICSMDISIKLVVLFISFYEEPWWWSIGIAGAVLLKAWLLLVLALTCLFLPALHFGACFDLSVCLSGFLANKEFSPKSDSSYGDLCDLNIDFGRLSLPCATCKGLYYKVVYEAIDWAS